MSLNIPPPRTLPSRCWMLDINMKLEKNFYNLEKMKKLLQEEILRKAKLLKGANIHISEDFSRYRVSSNESS